MCIRDRGVAARLPTIPPARPDSSSVADVVELGAAEPVSAAGDDLPALIGGCMTSGGLFIPHPPPPTIVLDPGSTAGHIGGCLKPASIPRGSATGMPRGPPGLPSNISAGRPIILPKPPAIGPPPAPRPTPKRPMELDGPLAMSGRAPIISIGPAPAVMSWFCMFLDIVSLTSPARPAAAITRCCISAIISGLSCICCIYRQITASYLLTYLLKHNGSEFKLNIPSQNTH